MRLRVFWKPIVPSLFAFALVFAARLYFFGDAAPTAADVGQRPVLAYEAAFLLSTIEKIALFFALVLAVASFAAEVRPTRHRR